MTTLSAQSIRTLCTPGDLAPYSLRFIEKPLLDPFHPRTPHNGMTFGLGPAGYDVRIRENLTIWAGAFVLASTLERFCMPIDVQARVADKSTWARRGLAVQNTVIDPGWEGWLTLEITNHGLDPIHVAAGDPICQIIFEWLDFPTVQPYRGKYQEQPAQAVPARQEPQA